MKAYVISNQIFYYFQNARLRAFSGLLIQTQLPQRRYVNMILELLILLLYSDNREKTKRKIIL